MISPIQIITILFLVLLVIILIVLIVSPNKIKEGFHPVFDKDLGFKRLIDKLNDEKKNNSSAKSLEEVNLNQSKRIKEIENEVNKFDVVLKVIQENINHIPVCREIDLKHRAAPDCSKRAGSECELNPFCEIDFELDSQSRINKVCKNKKLKKECEDIFEHDSNNNLTGSAKKFFVYPSILDEVNVL